MTVEQLTHDMEHVAAQMMAHRAFLECSTLDKQPDDSTALFYRMIVEIATATTRPVVFSPLMDEHFTPNELLRTMLMNQSSLVFDVDAAAYTAWKRQHPKSRVVQSQYMLVKKPQNTRLFGHVLREDYDQQISTILILNFLQQHVDITDILYTLYEQVEAVMRAPEYQPYVHRFGNGSCMIMRDIEILAHGHILSSVAQVEREHPYNPEVPMAWQSVIVSQRLKDALQSGMPYADDLVAHHLEHEQQRALDVSRITA